MPEFTVRSEEEMEALAARVARGEIVDVTAPRVLTLRGDLGAGKTTFVRGFVRALPGGAGVVVQSPTFALLRSYSTTPPVHHLDLYRFDGDPGAARSLVDLGLLDTIEDGLSLVEWPVAGAAWPAAVVDVAIAIVDAATRRVTIGGAAP